MQFNVNCIWFFFCCSNCHSIWYVHIWFREIARERLFQVRTMFDLIVITHYDWFIWCDNISNLSLNKSRKIQFEYYGNTTNGGCWFHTQDNFRYFWFSLLVALWHTVVCLECNHVIAQTTVTLFINSVFLFFPREPWIFSNRTVTWEHNNSNKFIQNSKSLRTQITNPKQNHLFSR